MLSGTMTPVDESERTDLSRLNNIRHGIGTSYPRSSF